jgi:hypothetical protein
MVPYRKHAVKTASETQFRSHFVSPTSHFQSEPQVTEKLDVKNHYTVDIKVDALLRCMDVYCRIMPVTFKLDRIEKRKEDVATPSGHHFTSSFVLILFGIVYFFNAWRVL